ncbi:DUF5615 family PIN-like protein [Pseudoduganella sp. OTU4001]|uniref:DUF5615 family PIN-like protein n=1 Tax=Pseudoduganella sp. OTU4001 TaxID=3043854 RepID=UPI00406CA2BE
MRLLLDESIPIKFQHALTCHQVQTVVSMGWSGLRNGELLAFAASEFDAFVTLDKNLKLESLLVLVPALEQTLQSIKPQTYQLVSA